MLLKLGFLPLPSMLLPHILPHGAEAILELSIFLSMLLGWASSCPMLLPHL